MKSIKVVFFLLMACMVSETAWSQKFSDLDASPADIVYFREGNSRNAAPVFRVIYGRPAKKGRQMLGGVEPFGKVWRLGANEATEIKLFRDVTFGGKKVSAGTYTMYAIPNADKWTLIFNKKLDAWGAYTYDESQDVARIELPTKKSDREIENFSAAVDGTTNSGNLYFGWENTLVTVPFTY